MGSGSYQSAEAAIVDLVRVGVAGNAAGVRQLANRLMRSLPQSVGNPDRFREQLAEAMVSQSTAPSFRSAIAQEPAVSSDLVHWILAAPGTRMPVLSPENESDISGLVAQWERQAELRAAGLTPANSVLLTGRPGVGKTMTARAIAHRLDLPLAVVNLAEVISSLLGGTGKNLRDAMQAALSTEAVLLMDEFDAVAKRRDDSTDIGELKRIVNVLLLELDRWPDNRLLIAATNHPHLLDSAVLRRFETTIEIGDPSEDERRILLKQHLGEAELSDWVFELVLEATAGLSPADMEREVRAARRDAFANEKPLDESLVARVSRRLGERTVRNSMMRSIKHNWKVSNREIARLFGVSHPTVAKALTDTKGTT